MATIQTGDDLFGVAKWIVDPTAGAGTHTTIGAALTSASSGDTIFIRPGTYTENPTLKAGVNLSAFTDDGLTPIVIINGTCSYSSAGTVSISGINLQTNSANILNVSGSAASIVNIDNCYLNCSNNTGISYSSSSSSSAINITNCRGDLGTTGIAIYSKSSTGTLTFKSCTFTNSGGSSTASTCSAGTLNISNSSFASPITSSGTGTGTFDDVAINTVGQNVTALTANNGFSRFCSYASGTASAVSVAGSYTMESCVIDSTNTNAITGSGTLTYSLLEFQNSSSTVNTSTQVPQQIGPKIYTNGGISFNAGTDVLSTYHTSTWTPNLQINGSSTGITYTTQAGGYTQIGNVVCLWANIVLSSKGSSTGNVTISNLPVSSGSNGPNQIIPVGAYTAVTLSNGTNIGLLLQNSNTVGQFVISQNSGVGFSGVTNSEITNVSAFVFTGIYITD